MKKWCCLVVLILLSGLGVAQNVISNYQRITVPVYTAEGKLLLALRVFNMNKVPSFLTVDLGSLQTQVIPINQLKTKAKSGHLESWNITQSSYYQLLTSTTAPPYLLENKGLRHTTHAGPAYVLSIDLCPSSKVFEKELFNKLVQLAEKNKKPTPVTIAISGMWLLQHPQEFQWLVTQEHEKKLAITWANHSFSHVYYHDLPYAQNFLLSPETNDDAEILLTEQYLLAAGQTPSVFFRFPGLVSNKELIQKIKRYGLIPLGTDAWMAYLPDRHESLVPGVIILVHGNGNEHAGIEALMPLMDQLSFVDIKQAL